MEEEFSLNLLYYCEQLSTTFLSSKYTGIISGGPVVSDLKPFIVEPKVEGLVIYKIWGCIFLKALLK